ncbi:MAG: Gfo/Idh/MocA family oxidoreductase [Bacteroidia bacterium]|jgi:predicted dehydrogenase|nr:Gfo/Idh/MocA family oxidoreductase [Bacteroidia bacterium]
MENNSRRDFLKKTLLTGAGLIVLPEIYKRSAFAGRSANKLIQFAQIGCGRQGTEDYKGTMKHSDLCRLVAFCDLDSRRVEIAKNTAVEFYKNQGETNVVVDTYHDFHELLARPDIDAVIVSVPDHQHALVAVQAVLAGKDVYVQKPLTYAIAEAKALRAAVRAKNRILQTGSQQRSEKPWNTFRVASEAVRNGRIGKVKSVKIGIGIDRIKGVKPTPEQVPANLDYDRWLGPAPKQPYMEARVHPQNSISGRPGWITTEDFGLGMITNWGAHHIDIMQWAIGQETGGPLTVESKAEFMKDDVWTVHTKYHVEMIYPGDIQVILDDTYTNGCLFEGTDGTVFCARGAERVTASDPEITTTGKGPLWASDNKILYPRIGPEGKIWMPSSDHYRNWLESILSRKDPIAPVEHSARSLEACAVAWISMKLNRKVTWDPKKEKFVKDKEANAMMARKVADPQYNLALIMKKAGLKY